MTEIEQYVKDPQSLYNDAFFKGHQKCRPWQYEIGKRIWTFLNSFQKLNNVIDFGCASGYYLEGIRSLGADICGYEYMYDNAKAYIPPSILEYIKYGNVMKPIDCGKYSIVMSFEVAEHILAEKSDTFVDNLVNATNNYIILTAAPPGQKGTAHINLQPQQFWVSKFESRGFIRLNKDGKDIENSIRCIMDPLDLIKNKIPVSCKYINIIRRNLMVFSKK